MPYRGAQDTASVRAALQHALDNYKPGNTKLFPSDITRSDTRTFGESHADELKKITSQQPGLPITPPAVVVPLPTKDQAQGGASGGATINTVTPPGTTQTATVAVAAPPSNAPGSMSVPFGAPPAKSETAEEEKKRLEREEREKILHDGSDAPSSKDEELPPYREL
jgi:hypothetical protein